MRSFQEQRKKKTKKTRSARERVQGYHQYTPDVPSLAHHDRKTRSKLATRALSNNHKRQIRTRQRRTSGETHNPGHYRYHYNSAKHHNKNGCHYNTRAASLPSQSTPTNYCTPPPPNRRQSDTSHRQNNFAQTQQLNSTQLKSNHITSHHK